MTVEQAKCLVPGDKVIFIEGGGVLSWKRGRVFTFSNLIDGAWSDGSKYMQFKEMHDRGNHVHNAGLQSLEKFDPEVHKEYKEVTGEMLLEDQSIFKKTYGS